MNEAVEATVTNEEVITKVSMLSKAKKFVKPVAIGLGVALAAAIVKTAFSSKDDTELEYNEFEITDEELAEASVESESAE